MEQLIILIILLVVCKFFDMNSKHNVNSSNYYNNRNSSDYTDYGTSTDSYHNDGLLDFVYDFFDGDCDCDDDDCDCDDD